MKLIKYWLEVSNDEQARRFEARIQDPLRQWKLSPVDLPSRERWYDYSRARDEMFKATDSKYAPWYIIRSDDKKRARLNCIAHLLGQIEYKRLRKDKLKLPGRSKKGAYDDQAALRGRHFVQRFTDRGAAPHFESPGGFPTAGNPEAAPLLADGGRAQREEVHDARFEIVHRASDDDGVGLLHLIQHCTAPADVGDG